ncbi:MAG: hypothetical protein ABW042_11045 [Phenylobacterium sp.]
MRPLSALVLVSTLLLAAPADAQLLGRRAPAPAEPPQPWPYPPPDAEDWWKGEWPVRPEAADPLAGRKLGRERTAEIDNGIDANLYRAWALPPLQWQVLYGDEAILEAWIRPSGGVRQTVVRLIARRDGKAFVQVRAGLACCEAGIARRVVADAELPPGSADQILALRGHAMWSTPREVRVTEAGDTADALCVEGTSYDLTLLVRGRAASLRRACDRAEIGQVADALELAVRSALGKDTRIDVLFPKGADFSAERRAYAALLAEGGALQPARKPPAP